MEGRKLAYYSEQQYMEALEKIIPKLLSGKLPTKEGKESVVYFTPDNYVIKRYKDAISEKDMEKFDLFYTELRMMSFSMECNIPKTYACVKIPSKTETGKFDVYLLQEKISGKELFEDGYFDPHRPQCDITLKMYDNFCKNFCTKQQFIEAVTAKEGDLFERIGEEYINYFIGVNRKLLSMSTEDIDDFIKTLQIVRNYAKHTACDISNRNIIFDGKKLTLIDVGCDFLLAGEENSKQEENENTAGLILNDVLGLFADNYYCNTFVKQFAKSSPKLKALYEKNVQVCSDAIMRFVAEVNKLEDPYIYEEDRIGIISMKTDLLSFLPPEKVDAILGMVKKDEIQSNLGQRGM